jgi:hypothetical protein
MGLELADDVEITVHDLDIPQNRGGMHYEE